MGAEFKSSGAYRKFAQHVLRSARYVRDAESEEFLTTLVAQARHRTFDVSNGAIFWRAQIGQGSYSHYEGDEYIDDFPDALPPERMKPLPDRAYEGRANPKGIPYLYVASKQETAIAEVRPWLGLTVSLAQVKALRDLTFVDCTRATKPRGLMGRPLPEAERDNAVWWSIDRAFAEPVTRSDDVADYVPTQIIAEAFKVDGFDGIVYHSAFGGGYNVVIFDLDAADVINCTLYEIKNITFAFKQAASTYFVSKHFPKKETP